MFESSHVTNDVIIVILAERVYDIFVYYLQIDRRLEAEEIILKSLCFT